MTLSAEERERYLALFRERGYAIIEGLLSDDDLEPVVREYEFVVDRLAEAWLKQGKVSDYDRNGLLADRLLRFMRDTDGACHQHLDISLPLVGQIREDTPMHLGAAVFDLLRNPRLLDAVEIFIGGEIYSNPVQHMRIKPPERYFSKKMHDDTLISKTFWHQDQAVISEEADDSDVLSVWFPVMDVNEEEGCLLVVPGSHHERLQHHCRTATLNGIPESLVGNNRVPLPMKRGDVLFLHKLTKHASLPNISGGLRWSFDVRYNPIGHPTGRPWFPGFVARSRSRPDSALADH